MRFHLIISVPGPAQTDIRKNITMFCLILDFQYINNVYNEVTSAAHMSAGKELLLMKVEQLIYQGSGFDRKPSLGASADWVLMFGARYLIENDELFDQVRRMYPSAYIMGCSTAGEINGDHISEDGLCLTAVHLEKSEVRFADICYHDSDDFFRLGTDLIDQLEKKDLRYIFLLSEGVNINGSLLVRGLDSALPETVSLTGGLAGDGNNFKKTVIIANDHAQENKIVCAAFYGDILAGSAYCGGWKPFGIGRLVTRSEGPVLYELDHRPALDLYKDYLGESAKDLPMSGLRFPLSFRPENADDSFIRSVQGIDEESKSLLFRADIPQSSYCRLTRANAYNLIDGAKEAADLAYAALSAKVDLAIVISCRGRKFILRQRADEELEAIRNVVGEDAPVTGFYSYGELVKYKEGTPCEMHNQTLAITLLSEQ